MTDVRTKTFGRDADVNGEVGQLYIIYGHMNVVYKGYDSMS